MPIGAVTVPLAFRFNAWIRAMLLEDASQHKKRTHLVSERQDVLNRDVRPDDIRPIIELWPLA